MSCTAGVEPLLTRASTGYGTSFLRRCDRRGARTLRRRTGTAGNRSPRLRGVLDHFSYVARRYAPQLERGSPACQGAASLCSSPRSSSRTRIRCCGRSRPSSNCPERHHRNRPTSGTEVKRASPIPASSPRFEGNCETITTGSPTCSACNRPGRWIEFNCGLAVPIRR